MRGNNPAAPPRAQSRSGARRPLFVGHAKCSYCWKPGGLRLSDARMLPGGGTRQDNAGT